MTHDFSVVCGSLFKKKLMLRLFPTHRLAHLVNSDSAREPILMLRQILMKLPQDSKII